MFYCAPRRRTGKGRGREGSGYYPEATLLQLSKLASPALAGEVARKAALLPSFEIARNELEREGCKLDIKVVHRLTLATGQALLTDRKRCLLLWRAGELPKGSEFAGKRVGLAIDGGRTRMREEIVTQKGKGIGKTRKRGWEANWREPKKFVIYELDENGRMKAGTQAYIDGTTQGPDELLELLCMRMHQLGVCDAAEITIISDGAQWIWNRLPQIVALAKLEHRPIHRMLDFYHAAQHLKQAAAATGLDLEAQKRIFRRQRRQLLRGRIDLVIAELREYAQAMEKESSELRREIDYFEKHREHMNYRSARENGRPMGSGAIESAIRRVLNQRLKGNGTMWLPENAEAMMALRSAALTGRWEEILAQSRASMAADRIVDWRWSSPDLRLDATITDENDAAEKLLVVDNKRLNTS